MKYLFLLVLIAFSAKAVAQDSNQRLIYVQKIEKYKKMKTGGTIMIVAGAIMTIVGVSNMSSATYTTNAYGQATSTDPNATSGALLFLGGVSLLGGGIPLTIIGSKQQKKYQAKLNGLTLGFKITPQQSGVALTYRF